jgi:hypothetical protein
MPNTNKQKTAATITALIGAPTVTGTGGFLYLAADGCPTMRIPVASADRASALLSRYRDRFGIGASDMKQGCGDIHADDGTLVARVSYNGRVWTPEGNLLQEPGFQA